MDKLWAPWREKYVTKDIRENKGCVFCRILKETKDKANYVVARTDKSFAVLNLYPYNNGHTLILPKRHIRDLSMLKRPERDDLLDLLEEVKACLEEVLNPDGFNIGLNIGRSAGAGFPGHLHFHVVPRWQGDVNFMPVTGETKVISQSLKVLHKQVTDAYKKRR